MIKIESTRLVVRTLNDAEITQFTGGIHVLNANGLKNKFGIFLKSKEENQGETFVGSITDGSKVSANINIDENQQNKKYGTKAFKLYCHYKFEVKKSEEILECFASPYSEKMAKTIGFHKVIDKKFQMLIDNGLFEEDEVTTYKITKEKFYEKNSDFTAGVTISEVPKSTLENIMECLMNMLRDFIVLFSPKKNLDNAIINHDVSKKLS